MSSWNSGFLWVIASHRGICFRSAALLFFSASSSSLEMFLARVSTFFPGRCCSKAFIDPRCYNNNSSLIFETVSTDVVTAEFSGVFFGSERKKKVTKIQKSISCISFKGHALICGSGWTDKLGVWWVYIYKDCITSPLHSPVLGWTQVWISQNQWGAGAKFLRGDFGSYWQGARCSVALLALFK